MSLVVTLSQHFANSVNATSLACKPRAGAVVLVHVSGVELGMGEECQGFGERRRKRHAGPAAFAPLVVFHRIGSGATFFQNEDGCAGGRALKGLERREIIHSQAFDGRGITLRPDAYTAKALYPAP